MIAFKTYCHKSSFFLGNTKAIHTTRQHVNKHKNIKTFEGLNKHQKLIFGPVLASLYLRWVVIIVTYDFQSPTQIFFQSRDPERDCKVLKDDFGGDAWSPNTGSKSSAWLYSVFRVVRVGGIFHLQLTLHSFCKWAQKSLGIFLHSLKNNNKRRCSPTTVHELIFLLPRLWRFQMSSVTSHHHILIIVTITANAQTLH